MNIIVTEYKKKKGKVNWQDSVGIYVVFEEDCCGLNLLLTK
jgi:hypothetical protein